MFSSGNFCLSSHLLRQKHLQYESYPLDWLLFDNFNDVLNLIENRYEGLIDPQYFEKREKYGYNDVYYNKHYHVELRHDFRQDTDFDENLQIVKKRYQRRIKRVLERIRSAQTILAVHCAENCTDDNETITKQFLRLQKIFSGKQTDLLFINLRDDISQNDCKLINEHILKMNIAAPNLRDYKALLKLSSHCLDGFDTSLKVKFLQRLRSFAVYIRKPLLKLMVAMPLPQKYKNKIKAIYKDRFRA